MAQAVAAPGQNVGATVSRAGPRTAARGGNKWWVVITVIFGVFVSILDSTIVNTAIPKIEAVFGAGLHQASYIATAYTLAAGVVVGASSYLAARFGIKRVFLTSLTLFTIGSALCGLAWNIDTLILFRILQGAGGAALFPLGISMIFATFPPEERGLVNGVFGIPVLFAPAIGPTLGGYIVQYIDWRWIFYVNVPIGILGVFIGLRSLPESPLRTDVRFDLRGFLLIAIGLALLLYGLSNLAYDGWSSLLTVSGPTVVSLFLLTAFIVASLRTANPLLDLRVFRYRSFWAGNVIIWLATVGLFGGAFYLPQYLQVLRGLDPFHSGLQLLPQGLAAIVATVFAGALYNRVGPRVLMTVGALAMTLDTYAISTWIGGTTAAYALLAPLLIVRGLALPPIAQTSNTVALQDIRGAALPSASTIVVVSRQVVASLALAVLGSFLTTKAIVHNADLASQVTRTSPAVTQTLSVLVGRFEQQGMSPGQAQIEAVSQLVRGVGQQAQALAFQDVFLISAAVTVPAILLPLLIRSSSRRGKTSPGAPVE